MPVFQGSDEEKDEKRDIIRPRLASRLMPIFFAVYPRILQAGKTNSCPLLESPARNLPVKPATQFHSWLRHSHNPLLPEKSAIRNKSNPTSERIRGQVSSPESLLRNVIFWAFSQLVAFFLR